MVFFFFFVVSNKLKFNTWPFGRWIMAYMTKNTVVIETRDAAIVSQNVGQKKPQFFVRLPESKNMNRGFQA